MHQFSAHTVDHSSTTDDQTSDSNLVVSDSHTETDTESSVSTSDSEKSYADITRILMAQPDHPPQGQTSHTEPYVDIPSEVEEEMPESSATNQPPPAQAYTSSPSQKSSNGPWVTFDDLPSHKWRDRLNEMSAWIDLQMLCPGATTQLVLREFATRFTGALRDWFDSLGNYRQLQFVQLREVSSALAVIHDQFLGDPSAVFEAARRDYFNMKCCSLNAKDLDFHYKRIPRRSRKPYRFFRKKSSSSRDFKRRKSSRCFICKKKGHYAKDCPNKREKSIRLVEHLQATTDYSPENDELEFYFSEQDEPNDETVFALQNSSDDSDSDQSLAIFHQQLLSLDTSIPIPSIKLQILPSKFQRPIPAIGLIDTGAQRSMLNPHILPPEYWTEYEEHFKAVNGKLFTTSLITKKPIGSHDEHRQLLTQFYDIIQSHGIMLSAKKSTIATDNIEFLGLTLDPSSETTEDVLWYIWCLTVLYATKLVLPITPTLEHLLNPDKATSLTWTLLEWFSPIPWWRKKLQQLSEVYNLERMPTSEAQMFTSVFIIHRPYFQHPDTKLFWTQDQVYEWFTAPHLAVIENEIQSTLHNYLCQLNYQTPPHKDIFHTSLGPQHDLIMIPTPSAISKPKSIGIIIKEEKPDYTDFLYQDSQDPWEEFLPLSQHLQQFPQPSMHEPRSSSQPS
ncbi:hypothetical protein KPL70_003575 [Citrus sinensis]|nr:hypothetical protein KPL70_003575 [Citrus sinensis]